MKFNLRKLFAIQLAFIAVMAFWLAPAYQEAETVNWILDHGGEVYFDYQYDHVDIDRDVPFRAPNQTASFKLKQKFPNTLSSVRHVHWRWDEKRDLSRLRKLKRVKSLWLRSLADNDLDVIGRLKSLESLTIVCHHRSDLQFLNGLTKLRRLKIISTKVTDISALSSLTSLEYLNLSGVNITDIEVLGGLSELKELRLNRTLVSSADSLSKCKNLEYLDLTGTQVKDLSFQEHLKFLAVLIHD